jgi:hypothetical protein
MQKARLWVVATERWWAQHLVTELGEEVHCMSPRRAAVLGAARAATAPLGACPDVPCHCTGKDP